MARFRRPTGWLRKAQEAVQRVDTTHAPHRFVAHPSLSDLCGACGLKHGDAPHVSRPGETT